MLYIYHQQTPLIDECRSHCGVCCGHSLLWYIDTAACLNCLYMMYLLPSRRDSMSFTNDMLSKRRDKTLKCRFSAKHGNPEPKICPHTKHVSAQTYKLPEAPWRSTLHLLPTAEQSSEPQAQNKPALSITHHITCLHIKPSQPRYSGPQLAFAHVYATCNIKCI